MRIEPGQVAVITGAASGIGRGLAEALAARGMKLVLSDIRDEAVHATRDELARQGANATAIVTDVTNPDSVDELADHTMVAFGRVDLVCNNAGVVSPAAPMWEQSLATWRRMIDIKFLGVVHGVRSFAPHLLARGAGHILNTASSGGLAPLPNRTPYSGTMHAVVGMTETLNLELRATAAGVGATVLCPGLVDTPLGKNSAALGMVAPQPELDADAMSKLVASQGGIITARQAAESALDAIQADRVHAAPGGGVYERAETRTRSLLDDISHDRA